MQERSRVLNIFSQVMRGLLSLHDDDDDDDDYDDYDGDCYD